MSSTSVNAYVELPTTMINTRVQAISSSSDANAVKASSTSATRRSVGDGGCGGGGGGGLSSRTGSTSGTAAGPGSLRAATPIPRLTTAAAQRLARTPTNSIRKKPASAVPATAPSVLSP